MYFCHRLDHSWQHSWFEACHLDRRWYPCKRVDITCYSDVVYSLCENVLICFTSCHDILCFFFTFLFRDESCPFLLTSCLLGYLVAYFLSIASFIFLFAIVLWPFWLLGWIHLFKIRYSFVLN